MKKEYLVTTREDYDALMNELESKGIKWASGAKPTKYNGYHDGGVVIIVHDNIYIQLDEDTKYHPDAEHYNAKHTYVLDITEDQMRKICHCPKGYVMDVSTSMFNPFRIKEDGVYNKNDSWIAYDEFLNTHAGSLITITPEQPVVEEMTMEQVCEALGKTIKIIKE